MRTSEHHQLARAFVDNECVRESAHENAPKVTVNLRMKCGRGGCSQCGIAYGDEKRLAES